MSEERLIVLGDLEKYILCSILQNNNNEVAFNVRKNIKTRLGFDVTVGALYTTLNRLKLKGYLDSNDLLAGSKKVTYFFVTEHGLIQFKRSINDFAKMVNGIPDHFLKD